MSTDQLYFATSGIRGKSGIDITPDFALKVGKAIGLWILDTQVNPTKVMVGYDNRRNSRILAYTIAGGLTLCGLDVHLPEIAIPTPLLIHATVMSKANAGVIVTGSHLPAEDNGIILVDGLGNYFKGLMPVSSTSMTSWDKLGKQYFFDTQVQDYKQFLANFITFQEYGGFHGKLLIDPVHGPMRDYLLFVLDNPATTIVELNFEEDDLFPGRISEPTPDNLKWTSLKVEDENCDLGIATDMDGDRIIFILKNGDAISGDYIGALFAKWIWQKDPGAKVVVPINTSAVINHVADELNGTMIYCKVGPPSIIESIRDNNATFAFEETGKYIFPETAIWPDSAISLIFLLSGLAKKNSTLEKELNLFPKLYAKKIKLPCLRSTAPEVMRIVESELLQSLEGIKKVETMDGLRINFTNLSWLLIRPSGTEDYVRIFSEHADPDKNEELSNLGKSLVLEALKYLDSTE